MVIKTGGSFLFWLDSRCFYPPLFFKDKRKAKGKRQRERRPAKMRKRIDAEIRLTAKNQERYVRQAASPFIYLGAIFLGPSSFNRRAVLGGQSYFTMRKIRGPIIFPFTFLFGLFLSLKKEAQGK